MDTVKKYSWQIVLILLIFCTLFLSMKYFEDVEIISQIFNFEHIFITFILWLSLYFIIKGITDKTLLSLWLVAIIQIVFDIINYIVRISRGSGIMISDLTTLKTAYSVMGNLHIKFDYKFYIRHSFRHCNCFYINYI